MNEPVIQKIIRGDIEDISFDILQKEVKEYIKRQERTLLELQEIFENSLTGIMLVDENYIIHKINYRASKIFGYYPDDLLEQSLEKLLGHEAENDNLKDILHAALEGEILRNIEVSFYTSGGQRIFLRVNGKAIENLAPDGSPMVLWNIQDITHSVKNLRIQEVVYKISQTLHKDEPLTCLLKETQNHLSSILKVDNFIVALYDESRDMFTLPLMTDDYDAFSSFNAEGTISGLVAHNKRSYFLQPNDIDYLIKRNEIEVKGAMAKVWLGVPMIVNGNVIGVLVVQDYENENALSRQDQSMLEFLSEQISMAIDRKNKEEKLKNDLDTKNKFFSIIAHDLKSPFNSLIGLSSLLEQDLIDEEDDLKEIYKNLYDTSQEGYALLENLLLWTRSQLGTSEHHEEWINLHLVVQNVFSLQENNAHLKKIVLNNDIDPGLQIYGDKNKIQTVLRNLLSNAIKYSYPESSIEFSATVKKQDVVIEVKDHGTGMTKEIAERLFSPGSDYKRLGTNQEKGTGLGLLISREFIQHHHGRIWVESELGVGSVFYVAIPHHEQRQAGKKEKYAGVVSVEKQQQKQQSDKADKKLILVVEDVMVNFMLLKKILENLHCDVIRAENGVEAIKMTKSENPDLILMDINMPKMNGIEATRIIKENDPSMPIIIQTAYTSKENKEDSFLAGADDYIEKPIMRDELEKLLKKFKVL